MQREKWLAREDKREDKRYRSGSTNIKPAINPSRPNPRYDSTMFVEVLSDEGVYVEEMLTIPVGTSARQAKRLRMEKRKEESARKERMAEEWARQRVALHEHRLTMGFGEW